MDNTALLRLARSLRDDGYTFVTPTPATHARVNARPGADWAASLADVFGWSRPFRDGAVPAATFDLMREAGVLAPHGDGWRPLVRLSSLDGMLFVHSAYPTSAADAVFFGPDTYRFGSAMSAWLAGGRPVRRAVDVGCGAGPGALLVARARPDAEVLGVDVNYAALAMTRVNAALNGLDRVAARESDLLTNVGGEFDLIVSNPPYLSDPAERAYRHGGGTFGEGLSLAIVEAALPRLSPGGTLLLYTGAVIVNGRDPFRDAAARLCDAFGAAWEYRETDPDVFGDELDEGPYVVADRIAAVVLTAQRDG
jgi:SAM-dependent methyltransferase